jgi:hypothetical protein
MGQKSFCREQSVPESKFTQYDQKVAQYMRRREVRKAVVESMALPKNTGHSAFVNTHKGFFRDKRAKESKIEYILKV